MADDAFACLPGLAALAEAAQLHEGVVPPAPPPPRLVVRSRRRRAEKSAASMRKYRAEWAEANQERKRRLARLEVENAELQSRLAAMEREQRQSRPARASGAVRERVQADLVQAVADSIERGARESNMRWEPRGRMVGPNATNAEGEVAKAAHQRWVLRRRIDAHSPWLDWVEVRTSPLLRGVACNDGLFALQDFPGGTLLGLYQGRPWSKRGGVPPKHYEKPYLLLGSAVSGAQSLVGRDAVGGLAVGHAQKFGGMHFINAPLTRSGIQANADLCTGYKVMAGEQGIASGSEILASYSL